MEQKTLVDLLTSEVESERITTVADFLFQIETYTRNVSLMVAGFLGKHETDAERDLYGIKQSLDEVGLWLKEHYEPLYSRLQPKQVFMQEADKVVH